MKAKYFVVAVVVALSLSWEARSDDTQLRTRALRQARRIARTSPAGEVSTMTNTNFAGVWGGRYIYSFLREGVLVLFLRTTTVILVDALATGGVGGSSQRESQRGDVLGCW
jgi:hypothetical protein